MPGPKLSFIWRFHCIPNAIGARNDVKIIITSKPNSFVNALPNGHIYTDPSMAGKSNCRHILYTLCVQSFKER